MFKNYFKTAWRNISNKKFYAAINILGLSLGITCALFLYLFITFHFSFDRYHKDAATTYRIVNEIYFDKTVYIKGASIGMYNGLSVGNPNIRNAGVMLGNNSFTVAVKNVANSESRFKEDKDVALVSPSWFSIFDYTFISGNAKQLSYPNTAVITQSLANKYFGKSDPINQTIIFPNNVLIKIIGVVSDKPYNSDMKSSIYISLASFRNIFPNTQNYFFTDWSWIGDNTSLYLTLNNKQSKSLIEAEINDRAKVQLGDNAKYYHFLLQPLTDVHFDSNYGGVIQQSLLYTLMIIGICILIIASVNYVNLSIAQQARRMVEIGTRKVLGATPRNLFYQFMIETFLTIIIAIVISIIAVCGMFSLANKTLFAQDPIYVVSYKDVIALIGYLMMVLVILSGVYPAIVLSRIAVHKAFKNVTGSWKSGLLRRSLVIIQNAVACVLIVCTIIMVMQVEFLKHTEIGFNSNLIAMLPLPDTAVVQRNYLSNKLSEISQIKSYSFCHASPSSDNDWAGSIEYDNRNWESWPGLSEVGDSAYVNTFGLQLVAGRNMREHFSSTEFLINQKMVNKLGLKNPNEVVGKKLTVGEFGDKVGTIVGVVKDFNSQSLAISISPLVIADVPEKFNSVAVKLNGDDVQHTMNEIRKSWQQVFPTGVFEYHYVDDQIANLYIKEDIQQKIVWLAAMIAIVISCLGLLGLVSLMILQRTKEIGIRKVFGASVASITTMLSKDFLKLVVLAIIIAMPLAWWIMNGWLTNFAYHVTVSWWVFALAALLSIAIALITISFQSIKAAIANPVKSLRTE